MDSSGQPPRHSNMLRRQRGLLGNNYWAALQSRLRGSSSEKIEQRSFGPNWLPARSCIFKVGISCIDRTDQLRWVTMA